LGIKIAENTCGLKPLRNNCVDGRDVSMDEDLFLKEIERNPFLPKPKADQGQAKGSQKPPPSKEAVTPKENPQENPKQSPLPSDPSTFFLPYFFIELIQRIKGTLGSIKTFTNLSKDKMVNAEYKDYFQRIITEDVDEMESVLNSLIQYIKINTPIVKANTVHTVLDEALKRNESQIEGKKIKIIKKFEKELPETIVHEEQLRYIFHSLIEYAVSLTIPNGSIGMLTKSLIVPKGGESDREGRYVEIVVIFSGCRKSGDKIETMLGTPPVQKENGTDLTLMLVKEIVRKNHGEMKLEMDEKKPKTVISMVFPIERRKVVSYPTV
jgi:nitrogen-specific signal transduction histidine kinase